MPQNAIDQTAVRLARPWRRRSWIGLAGLVLAAAMIWLVIRTLGGRVADAWAVRGLTSAAREQPYRSVQPRLSLFDVYRRRPANRRGDDQEERPLGIQGAAATVLATLAPTAGHAPARAAAFLALNRARDAVQELRAFPATDAWVSADLAAALLVESSKTGRLELALDSLAAADAALRADPQLAEASFNRALALQRLGFLGEAREEWLRCARLDPSSGWAAEARQTATALEVQSDAAGWKAASAELERAVRVSDAAVVRRLVGRYPQLARVYGEGVYLGRWADGDAPALDVARAIGLELRRLSGESMLADAVTAIDGAAHGDRERLAALVEAHRLYREGRLAFRDHRLGEAAPKLLLAEETFTRGGSPMARMARYYRGAVLYEAARIGESQKLLDDLAATSPEQRGYRALAAQIGWERGLGRMVLGSFNEAKQIFMTSRQLLAELGETELEATFELHLAQLANYIGDSEEAWAHREVAFRKLSRSGNDYRIAVAADAAASSLVLREEWPRVAALATIAAAMATRLQEPQLAAEAFLLRSGAATHLGLSALADADVAEARHWIARIKDRSSYERLEAERAVASATTLRSQNAKAALGELDHAIAFFEESGHRLFLSRVYLERARAHRAEGDLAAAGRDVDAGIAIAEQQRQDLAKLDQRAAFFSTVQSLFVEGADLALAGHDAVTALDRIEQGRARSILDAFAGASRLQRPLSVKELQESLAPDAAIVLYALLPGRLAAFVVRDREVRVAELKVDLDRVNRAIAALASPAASGTVSIEESEEQLYDVFLAPIERDLAGATTVAVVVDPAFDHVPMNILRNRRSGRLAVDEYTFVEAPSASIAIECSRRQRPAPLGAPLIVAAYAFESKDSTPLLPAVAAEVETLLGLWPHAAILAGGTATRTNFVSGAPSAAFIHFAGHGTDGSGRPSDARLLLAGGPGERRDITAGELARLDLHATRLVVLNACRTSAPGRKSDGVSNVATAFVIAGVPNVIAAATDIDDDAAAELAGRLHGYLREGTPPELGLRNAIRDEIRRVGAARAAASYGSFACLGGSGSLIRQNRERKGRSQ